MMFNIILLVFATFLGVATSQIYVPAQILIPTYNGSVYNYSGGNYNNQASNNRPPAYGFNLNNQTQYNNSYNRPNNGYLYSNNNGSNDGHLFIGNIQTYDRLLFSQVYFKPSRWWTNREKIINYPSDLPSGYTRHETISAVRITNQFYDGNSARAVILKGGIERSFVSIKLFSKTRKGFRYLVQIYGH